MDDDADDIDCDTSRVVGMVAEQGIGMPDEMVCPKAKLALASAMLA